MDKRKYIALSLEEERRSTRPRLNNHNSNASTAPSKPKPNNSSNNNPASQPVNNNSPDQNVKEDPFKQVQGDELEDGDDDDDDDDGVKRPVNAKRAGRRKIKIEYIQEKSRRHITFSKRKSGIMKKAFELSTLTGTQVLLLVVSETGLVYTFTTPKLQPIVTKDAGRNLIQACLHSADPATADGAGAKSDEDDNDEPPQKDQEKENEVGDVNRPQQQQRQQQQQDGGKNTKGSGGIGSRKHDGSANQKDKASNRPSTSEPYDQPPPRYLPRPPPQLSQMQTQTRTQQGQTGRLMYPPPYDHIPYPNIPPAARGPPPGLAARPKGSGGAAGATPFSKRPYPGPGQGHNSLPPPPPPPNHLQKRPPRPHPHPHPHPPQGQKQQHGKSGRGNLSTGQGLKGLQTEE